MRVADLGSSSTRTVEHLEQALQSSRLIGAAIGMVMASRGVGYDEALAILKETSSRSNIKLRVLCAEMVAGAAPPDASDLPVSGPRRWVPDQ